MNAPEGAVNVALALLAMAGAVAILLRLFRALLRMGVTAAGKAAVSGMAELSARRGDLTGVAERRAQEMELGGARRRSVLRTAGWLALLIVPLILGVAREVYALAALLWVVPRRRRGT